MALLIRKTLEKDIPDIAALESVCFSFPHSEEQLRRELDNPAFHLLTAEEDGVFAGYIGLSAVIDEGYITNVAVSKQCRGRGTGSRLVKSMLSLGEELRLSFISLEVRESNSPAVTLYSHQGFSREGIMKDYYTLPRENAIIMTYKYPTV